MAGDRPRVRVRGIYATALTGVLQETDNLAVVDASRAIDRRFDVDFDGGIADVTIRMTDDRQGIGITGTPEAVARVSALVRTIGEDTFSWPATAPVGTIVEGRIVRTNRGGAIVDLGDRAGFLPFGATDDYLDEGDTVRVQVHEQRPPWSDSEPGLGTDILAVGEIATLVRGVDALVAGTPDGRPEHELARTTEMLSTDVPDGWGVRWEYPAQDADMSVLDSALAAAVDRATTIEAALDAGSEATGTLASPTDTTWVWFGRETRFVLDDQRATVTPTMSGHHRIKAGSTTAGTAVDFAEHLDAVDREFPFGAVTGVFGPAVGDEVAIRHGKPDGRCLTLGTGTVTDVAVGKRRITVEREMSSRGTYDALGTAREPGDTATTRFTEGRWWYPTVYRGENGRTKGTYVNIATPVEVFPRSVRYMDLHVDVIKEPDGTVSIVDEEELAAAVDAGQVPESVAETARSVAERVTSAFEP